MYLFALSVIVSSVLFFTSKTEQSRIVAIHRPIMITQERKTPAYYVYQQANRIQQKIPQAQTSSTYLSNLSLAAPELKIEITEMKFNKREFAAQMPEPAIRSVALFNKPDPEIKNEIKNLTYEQVFSAKQDEGNLNSQSGEAQILSPSKKWATIRGKFELIDGVGIVDHYIELKRIEEGQVREIGRIDLKAGLYTIDIESPNGYLVAQIKDRNGGLIGVDREKLINLQSRGSFFEGPFIRVGRPETIAANPAPTGNASVVAAKLLNKTSVASASTQDISVTLFDNQSTLSEPNGAFMNISKYSSTISRVFDPSRIYKNVTSIRQTGEKTETSMFTTKWVNGVIEYISDAQKIEFISKNGPILIGRVLSDGKPVTDAKVEIDTAPGVAPIYFDQFMIPSFTQSSTSENGYFMFVGLEPNNYHIVAIKQNVIIGSQMFIGEEETVAFQNISGKSIPRTKVIRSFDAFSSEPVAAEIISTEIEDTLQTPMGTTVFKTFSESSVSEYITRSNNTIYAPLRYVQNSRQEYVHIPMLQQAWIVDVKKFKQIFTKPNTGTIVGFSTDLEYDAYLVSEDYDKNNIVYFDNTGQVTSAPARGGGFMLYNVPVGAREIVLQERNSDKIYSQVFDIHADQISAAHFLAD